MNKKPTTKPLNVTIKGKTFKMSAVKNVYNTTRDWWECAPFSVTRWLDTRKSGLPPWEITMSGPWYGDSDPQGMGATLEEAVSNFEDAIDRWVSYLQTLGQK